MHGSFLQVAESHYKHGCEQCGLILMANSSRNTAAKFVKKAKF